MTARTVPFPMSIDPARYPRLSTTLTAGACVSLAIALEQALRM